MQKFYADSMWACLSVRFNSDSHTERTKKDMEGRNGLEE